MLAVSLYHGCLISELFELTITGEKNIIRSRCAKDFVIQR